MGEASRVAQAGPRVSENCQREAPPRQFFAAAGWFQARLEGEVFACKRKVSAQGDVQLGVGPHEIRFHASPCGGDAVLLRSNKPTPYFAGTLGSLCFFFLKTGARLVKPAWQSLWEFTTLLVWEHLSVQEIITNVVR